MPGIHQGIYVSLHPLVGAPGPLDADMVSTTSSACTSRMC